MSAEETTPDPITAALDRHAERLAPGSVAQLSTLWRDELADLHPSVVADIVALRLARPENAKFLAPVRTGGVLSPDDQLRQQTAVRGVGNLLAGRVRHPAAS